MEVLPILGQHMTISENMWVSLIASYLKHHIKTVAGVPLTELINENTLSLGTNISTVPIKLLLTVPAVSVPGLILCKAKFIDEHNWCCSYTDLAKKM